MLNVKNKIFWLLIIVASILCWTSNAESKAKTQEQRESDIKNSSDSEPLTKLNIESYDWQGEIPSARLVVVKNRYGSIRSRNHSDNKVFFHATFQEIGESPQKPEFEISEQQGVLYINVKYAKSVFDEVGKLNGRTDVSILFPESVGIYAETDQGLIQIDKTDSPVEAVSRSGDIKLTTTGLFSARTDSGKINLKLRGFNTFGKSTATTKTGLIDAIIFNDMAIRVKAKTDGKLSVNQKVKPNGFVLQQGKDFLETHLTSVSGDIEIQTISPPDLVRSMHPSSVNVMDVDLRDLPKVPDWKPGDPIFNRNDKVNNQNKSDKQNNQSQN